MAEVKCIICGKKRLRVARICPDCLKRAADDLGQMQKLRQISNILSIATNTDGNVKECIQSMAEILEDLQGGSYGKEKKQSNTI